MRDHYFDFNTLKEDLIEALEEMDSNDPGSSEALVKMYNIMRDGMGDRINLHHNDVKELVSTYKSVEEDLESEYAEDIPSAADVTSLVNELQSIKMKLLNIAKIKIQQESNFETQRNVTPEELVTYWLSYGI